MDDQIFKNKHLQAGISLGWKSFVGDAPTRVQKTLKPDPKIQNLPTLSGTRRQNEGTK